MNALKNIGVTALMVILATMGSAALAMIATLLVAATQSMPENGAMLLYSVQGALVMAAFAGFVVSIVTVPVAALTMPPALGLIRVLNLPRPVSDIIGGGLAGVPCAWAAIAMLESLAQAKGGSAPDGNMMLVLEASALISGGMLGYLRHAVFVRPKAAAPLAYA